MKKIYLDFAAATPLDSAVQATMAPYFTAKFYNPSATYLAAKSVNKDINEARGKTAHWLGCRPNEITFTAGGTEANNLAINGVMQAFPTANVLVSAVEHESVLKPAEQHKHKIVTALQDGRIDLNDLKKKIDDKTVLVSVMYANNEIGTVQPLKDIAKIIDEIRIKRARTKNNLPIYFHTDACQAANYLDLHAHRLGVDLMTINGGKIYGPKQSGALFIKTCTKIQPQILGGGQENGLRSGTENVPAIIGLAKALDITQTMRREESNRLKVLQQLFINQLLEKLPGCMINGSITRRLPNNAHVTIPGQDNERLMMALDERGIMCATGSACSASAEEPSHVLEAIGVSKQNAQSSLRFTMGRTTTKNEIIKVVHSLILIVHALHT